MIKKFRVKAVVSLEIDPEEYRIPADGYVAEDIEESMLQHFFDIDGVEVVNLKVLQRGRIDE
tara:strand:- start:187 stop:372 length:186 start_codon:yes stop_codon:yes gene_type:complete